MNKAAPRSKIIAEIGVNHDGSVEQAMRLVDASVTAGADAVKFQSFTASELASEQAGLANYQSKQVAHANQREMLERLELGKNEFRALYDYCEKSEIEFMSTAFGDDWLDFLVDLGVRTIKWPSGELTNHAFLEKASRTGLPLILSTGMASLDEVAAAVAVVRNIWQKNPAGLTVLHCTSLYPAPVDTLNLLALKTLQEELGVDVGYSDHSEGITAGPICVALGATVFEKHITYDNSAIGPDHSASLEPDEFARYVEAIRWAERSLGFGVKEPHSLEADTSRAARKSVFVNQSVAVGSTLSEDMLFLRRPGDGIGANEHRRLIGMRVVRPLVKGQQLSWEDVE